MTVVLSVILRFWRHRQNPLGAMMTFFTLGQCVNAMFVDTTSFFSSMPIVILTGFASYKYLRNGARDGLASDELPNPADASK